MYNELAVKSIMNYMQDYLFEPKGYWPKYWFEQRVYSRWAASEILELIMDRPLTPPDEVVYEFMLKMVIYSEVTESQEKKFIFSTAMDTAEDILNLI